jgi:D-glycerate 3-kinase
MSAMIADKKCGTCVFLILYLLHKHKQKWTETDERPPLFLGLNGVQGAGKSVLVCAIA